FTYDLADYQPDLAYMAIDAGADAVVGTHPHCLQGIDQYQGKPIFYSFGNFIFDQPESHAPKSLSKYLKFYGLTPTTGAAAYPHPSHTRDTMIAMLSLSDRGVVADIVPARIDETATPRPYSLAEPEGRRIGDLIKSLSAELGTSFVETPDGR